MPKSRKRSNVKKPNVKKSVKKPKVRKSVSKTNVKKSVRKPKVRKSVKKLYKMGGDERAHLDLLPPIDPDMFRHSYPTAEEHEMSAKYAIPYPYPYQLPEMHAITHSRTPKMEEPMRINYTNKFGYTDEVAYREDHDEWRMRTGFKKPLTREEQKAKAKALARAKSEAQVMGDDEMVAVHYMSPRPPLSQRGPTISREYLSEFRRGGKTNRYKPYVTAARYEAAQNRRGPKKRQ